MKIHIAVVCLLFLCLVTAQAQSGSYPAPATQQHAALAGGLLTQPKIDPAKEADIRKLLDLSGAKALAMQMMDSMQKDMKPMLLNSFPPGEYREKLIDLFLARFHSKASAQNFLDIALPVYDKYFSHEEIKGLIQFYSTPLGQKTLSTLPKLTAELYEDGRKWGEQIGHESMQEVLTEHPDLQKAMEDASKSAQPR